MRRGAAGAVALSVCSHHGIPPGPGAHQGRRAVVRECQRISPGRSLQEAARAVSIDSQARATASAATSHESAPFRRHHRALQACGGLIAVGPFGKPLLRARRCRVLRTHDGGCVLDGYGGEDFGKVRFDRGLKYGRAVVMSRRHNDRRIPSSECNRGRVVVLSDVASSDRGDVPLRSACRSDRSTR